MQLASRRDQIDHSDRGSPLNVHIGLRITTRRKLQGLSEQDMAELLGLSVEQIQSYERGVQRLNASRLHELSKILDVPISYFFADVANTTADPGGQLFPNDTAAATPNDAPDMSLFRRESIDLLRDYYKISDPAVRRRVTALVKSLASGQ